MFTKCMFTPMENVYEMSTHLDEELESYFSDRLRLFKHSR